MAFQPNFSLEEVKKRIAQKMGKVEEGIIAAFNRACLEMVRRAKEVNTYQDQTGYLRSSIGYVLYHNGMEVGSYFTAEPPGADGKHESKGEQGTQSALEYARSIAEGTISTGFVAVIVAGAGYARYVESKGFDVLTGSSFQFNDDLKEEFLNIEKAMK